MHRIKHISRRAAVDLNIPLLTNARLAEAFINAFCGLTADDNFGADFFFFDGDDEEQED